MAGIGKGGPFGGFVDGYALGEELAIKERDRLGQKAGRDREFYAKVGEQLTAAMLEEDQGLRNTTVDAILRGVEEYRGKPVGKEFKSWLTKSPEQAVQVLNTVQERGVDPSVIFQVSDNPLLFAQGLLALGKANSERRAAATRGDGGGFSVASGAPTEQGAAPGGSGLKLGGVTQEQPYSASQAPAAGAQSAPAGEDADVVQMRQRVVQLGAQINSLAQQRRPESEIAPLRQEKNALEAELRKPSLARRTKGEEQKVDVVTREEIQTGIEAAQRAGRADLAQAFRPGMRREAYDGAIAQLGTTQTAASQPNAPTASAPSPITSPAGLGTPSSALSPQPLGQRPIGLVPTKEEEVRRGERIKREEQPLATDLARDPALRGIRTQGQLEASGRNPSTAAELARASTLATKGAEATVADFETVKRDGMAARTQQRYLEILAGAAQKAGARGPWLTPVRESLNNLANLVGVANPWGQDKLQLMQAITPKLAVLLTQQMKGQQSDREFLAALSTAPSVNNTEKGFAMLVYAAREVNKLNIAHDLAARQWVAKYGALDGKNPQGKTFQEDFDEAVINHDRISGSLQERVASAFNMKVSDLLKQR